MSISVFHLDAGGCGACGAELQSAVAQAPELTLVWTPAEAQVIALTGVIMSAMREAVLHTLEGDCAHLPLVVVGRCALHGTPFGQGGVDQWNEVEEEHPLRLRGVVEGCPPVPKVIIDVLLQAVQQPARR